MTRSASYAQKLAQWVHQLDAAQVPADVIEKVRSCLLDWLASAYAGSTHPTAERYIRLARQLGESGNAPIAGRPERTSIAMSMLANGALGHIAETDDGHRASIMHPGAVVFPTVLALALHAPNPGKALIEGTLAGYELAIRVGEALGPDHYATWHTTSTAGVFGAAAAAAKILGLKAEETAAAFGHAGTQSSGLWQFLEDGCVNAKPFHPGKACFDGYLAACAAQQGINGAHRIFEGSKGLLPALARPAQPQSLTCMLGSVYKIMEANVKGYPTCGQTHSMIDALDTLCREHGLTADTVSHITARVYERAVQVAGNLDPQNLEEAKFSITYCLAYRLVHGRIPFAGLTADSVFAPQIRAVMQKITLVVDEAMTAGFPAARPCVLEVACTDGRTVSQHNMHRRGDPENPMSFDAVAAKFHELVQGVIPPQKAEHIVTIAKQLPVASPHDLQALF